MDRVLRKLRSLKRRGGSKLTKSTSLSSSLRLSSWDFETSSDDEEWLPSNSSSNGGSDPVDVPEGCFAVYVGTEEQRFVVAADHLRHPWLKALLVKSAEEFGYDSSRLLIPCEAVLFEHLLWLVDRSVEVEMLEIDELLGFYS